MTVLNLWDSIWIGCLASVVLYGCYRAVEWRWPERYIGMHETFGLSSQETWFRFLAYRALPTYLVAATSCVTVGRIGGLPWVAAGVMWVLSIALTHGRVIVEAIRSRRGEVNYAGYHVQMVVLLTGVMIVAVLSDDAWGTLVPAPEEFLTAIWSGLLVAGLGGFVVVTLKPRAEGDPYYGAPYFIDRATRDVGIGVLDWLFAEAIRTGADPILLKSLLVVEAVQRPKWLRRIERAAVWIGIARTSGVMQMTSRRPLSDRESVTLAAEAYSGVWSLRYNDNGSYSTWMPDLGELWPIATRHNADGSFAEAVSQVATSLIYSSPGFTHTNSRERGVIVELRRYPDKFALRGISRSPAVVIFELVDGAVANLRPVEFSAPSTQEWRAWEMTFSPSAAEVAVVDMPSGLGTHLSLSGGEISHVKLIRTGAEPVEEPVTGEVSASGSNVSASGAEASPDVGSLSPRRSATKWSRGPRLRRRPSSRSRRP